MPAAIPNPSWPVYLALGISVLANIVTIIGWFMTHLLTKRREAQRDKRLREESATAKERELKEAMRLTPDERDLLRECGAADGAGRGSVFILRTSCYGSFVQAGKRDFFDPADAAIQARYLSAFESLNQRGYFRHEGDMLYQLTALGFERAKQET